MIKIVHVISDTNLGGAGVWLLNYLKAFDRDEYEVSTALPPGSLLKPLILKLGIPVFEVKGTEDKSFSKEAVREFKKLFLEVKPDIVHTHAALSARIAAKSLKIKTVNTRHCLEDKKAFLQKHLSAALNNLLSNIIIGVSDAVCKNLIDEGVKKSKVKLVYNGVCPPEKQDFDKKLKTKTELLGIPEGNIVIGMIARLEPVKNHKLLFDAANILLEKYDNLSFLIVGGGSLELELKEYVKNLGISDNVIFTGEQLDISDFINVIDIMALTSEKEALSLSLIEGMYLGIPSVATDSGGPCEVVDSGKTGYVTENHNIYALCDAFSGLIENETIRKEMGENAALRAENIFSVTKMTEKLDKIYKNLLEVHK